MSRIDFGRWTLDIAADSISTPRAPAGVDTPEVYELRLQDITRPEDVERCVKDIANRTWLTSDDMADFRSALEAWLEEKRSGGDPNSTSRFRATGDEE